MGLLVALNGGIAYFRASAEGGSGYLNGCSNVTIAFFFDGMTLFVSEVVLLEKLAVETESTLTE